MDLIFAFLATTVQEAGEDPTRSLVMKFLASYLGIVAGVSFLVESLKGLFKTQVKGREKGLALLLTFALGTAAKLLLPHYGGNTPEEWVLHEVVLVFVGVGSAAFHNDFLNVVMRFLGLKKAASPAAPAAPPAPPPAAPVQ